MASIAKLVISLKASISQFEADMQRAGRISKRQLPKMESQFKQLNQPWNRNLMTRRWAERKARES